MHRLLRSATLVLAGLSAAMAGVGEPLPAFALKDTAGREVRSADFEGKVRILVFFASWSEESRNLLRGLAAEQERLGKDGIATIGLSLDVAGPERVRAFAAEVGASFPILLADPKTSRAFDVRRIPTTFIADGEGKIKHRHDGPREGASIAAEARSLLGS